MRIAITGATGNVGSATVRALVGDPEVTEVIGIARRPPEWQPAKTRWVQADIVHDDLRPHFDGVDAVLHLAWLIQPSRNRSITERVNVDGSRRVFEAAAEVGVGALVHASSVAAYSPAHPDRPVDESWPTRGIPTSYYSQQKVIVERILDGIEMRHPRMRVARARPGLIFQRSAASQIRRFFGGPFLPGRLARAGLIPVIPDLSGLAGQVVHSDDVGQLYRLLLTDDSARGAYNAAAAPPLDAAALARLFGARPLPLPGPVVRAVVDATWRMRVHPVSPDWLDIARNVPVMLTDRARGELGWTPYRDSGEVMNELMAGLRENAGDSTPPLDPHSGGFLRLGELRSGIGGPNALDRKSARR